MRQLRAQLRQCVWFAVVPSTGRCRPGLTTAPLLPLPCSCLVPDLYKGKIGVDKEEASHLLSKL